MPTYTGTAGNDSLLGSTSADTLNGLAGDDTLDGGQGADWLYGGQGNDIYRLDNASDLVFENAGEGTDEVRTVLASYTLGANVENFTYLGGADLSAVGNALNNVINGGPGWDTLNGGVGADTLSGSNGLDLASYAGATTGVFVSLVSPGSNTGEAAGDVFSSIEGLIGGGYDDTLIGDSGVNRLVGGWGNDLLEGGAGADTLDGGTGGYNVASYANAAAGVNVNLMAPGTNSGDAAGDVFTNIVYWRGSAFADTLTSTTAQSTIFQGGTGNDVYGVDSYADLVQENPGEGTDEVRSTSNSYTLGANVENLSYVGAGALFGVGNSGGNVISGGSGADTLIGGAGADTLNGGGGLDTANYFNNPGGAISINLATGVHTGDATGDVFNSVETISATNYSDTLIGDANGNRLEGLDGADLLEGGGGADTLSGNSNYWDAITYEHSPAGISLNFSTYVHTGGDAAGDALYGFDMLVGSAYADTFTDNAAGYNRYMGGPGADVINGNGGGCQVMYSTSAAGVSINLATGAASGGDATGDTLIDVSGVRGSAYADSLVGDAGYNILFGGGGNDTIVAGGGNDYISLTSDAGLFSAAPAAYAGFVDAGTGNDTILQGALDAGSTIDAGDGDDSLLVYSGLNLGGNGADTFTAAGPSDLYGEAGDDSFVFQVGGSYANGGEGSDTYRAANVGISYVEETGSVGTDSIVIPYAATASSLAGYYDSANDIMYLTTTADAADGVINSGVAVIDWSFSGVNRLVANDGSYILI